MSGVLTANVFNCNGDNDYTVVIASAVEINGDHIATIDFNGPGGVFAGICQWYKDNVLLGPSESFLFTSAGETYTLRCVVNMVLLPVLGGQPLLLDYVVHGTYTPYWADLHGVITVNFNAVTCCTSVGQFYRTFYAGVWNNASADFWTAVANGGANAGVAIDVSASTNAPDVMTCSSGACCNDDDNPRDLTSLSRTIDYTNAFTGVNSTAFYAANIPTTSFSVTGPAVQRHGVTYGGTTITGTVSKAANSYLVDFNFTMSFGGVSGTLCQSDTRGTTYGSDSTTTVALEGVSNSCGSILIGAANSLTIKNFTYPWMGAEAAAYLQFGFSN